MSTLKVIDRQVARQRTSFPTEGNQATLETWRMNRKRPREDNEDRSSLPGWQPAHVLSSLDSQSALRGKTRKSRVLTDINHQSPKSHSLFNQPSEWGVKYRRKDPPRRSPSSSPDSTNVKIVTDETRPVQLPGDETVTYVNNLFSPINKLQAIPLTLNELQRRAAYPECFGRAELVSYLRHSKTTGNEIISKYNVKSVSSRTRLNVLSRLCESEAKILANGIHKMNNEYFPTSHVVDTMKEKMIDEKNRLQGKEIEEGQERDTSEAKETVANTIELLENLKNFLKTPDEDLAGDLNIFERATHTFGCQNITNHITFLESYLEELQKRL